MGMTSMELIGSQRPKSAIKNTEENDEYSRTVKELKELRESQIKFFTRKNELDQDINEDRENENKKIIDNLLREENDEANESDDDNIELNHSSNFVNKSIKLNNLKNTKNSIKEKSEKIELDEEEELESEESDLDSIEELFRKSCIGLKELTSEIHSLNLQKNSTENHQNRSERSKSKKSLTTENNEQNNTVHTLRLNKLNRLKSKEKILIQEENYKENIGTKKLSSAEHLIMEADSEKNKTPRMPVISDKNTIKKPLIFPHANNNFNNMKVGGPKLLIKKENDGALSLNNNSLLEENLEKKPSNKIIFKTSNISSNLMRTLDNNKISPNSTLTLMKNTITSNISNGESNNNNSSFTNSGTGNTQKNLIFSKPSLNNLNSTINSGGVNFNSKINLNNSNNNDFEKLNNSSSLNTQTSSFRNQNINRVEELTTNNNNISINSSNNNNGISKNSIPTHLRSNSNLSENFSSGILNNLGSNGYKDKDSAETKRDISDYNNEIINTKKIGYIGVNKELNTNNLENEKIIINNKISDAHNNRENIITKKPSIMGAAYGNTGNSKPLIKTKSDSINKKQEDVNLLKIKK